MKEILNRLKSETPIFWKKVRKLMIVLGVIGGGLIAAPGVPEAVVSIAGYLVAIGVVGTTLSSLTKI